MTERLFNIDELVCDEGKTSREVIFQSTIHEINLWRVTPGGWVYPHTHPNNDDIWHLIQGTGEYYLSSNETRIIKPGDIAVAAPGDVHGVFNSGSVDIIVYSVLSPLPVEMESVPGFDYPV